MNLDSSIRNRWEYIRVILLKPTWEFLATGAFFTFLFVATWWRDNFASELWKHRLELKGVLPHWQPTIWLCIGLVVVICLILNRAYELWMIQAEALGTYQKISIPEFVIDVAKDGNKVIGFKLRNTSSQNLYNVAVANINSRVGEIGWWDNFFTHLEAHTGEIILRPSSRISGPSRFHDVSALQQELQNTPGGTNPEVVGKLIVFASDATNNRFRFSTDIQLWNGWTWRVWETERIFVDSGKVAHNPIRPSET